MEDFKEASASGNGTGGNITDDSMDVRGSNGQDVGNNQVGGEGQGMGMHYSIPGILHFLQHEWSRFEMERSQWEVEKAELQARIAFLQGERKGQENLKNDLVRRIKMLEYALKQERSKYHKLKYGPGPDGNVLETNKPPIGGEDGDQHQDMPPLESDNFIAVSNVDWRQGRQLLRQYLQEIGYTDTIIDVRSNRVRSLLGLNDNDYNEENIRNSLAMNGESGGGNQQHSQQQQQQQQQQQGGTTRRAGDGQQQQSNRRGKTLAEEMMLDTGAAVMANFDFLTLGAEVDDDDDLGEDVDDDGYNPSEMKMKAAKLAQVVNESGNNDDKDTEEVMNEFKFLNVNNSNDISAPGEMKNVGNNTAEDSGLKSGKIDFMGSGVHYSGGQSRPTAASGSSPKVSADKTDSAGELGTNLELGELEQLTIANDNESSYDITAPKETFRKTWSAKYTLRSHFDGVRALAFHPTEPVLITASEDQTLKLWNLQKTILAKKSASWDVEPVYTFRAHSGPVLCLAVSPAGEAVFSGGMDATVRCWVMPSPNIDPYDTYEPSVLDNTLLGHGDAVWGLSYHGPKQQLLSCSADGTVKLWKPSNKTQPLLRTFGSGEGKIPTSVDWVYSDPNHIVTSYSNADCVIYDVESGKPVIKLDTESVEMGTITKVISHPTLPLTIAAHEDRQIRFFDNTTGKLTHAMVAHLDAVTSLSVDTNGLYLISGSHDCSIRLWNLETKTCVQEITAHRKKFDESIFDVAFHPSKPFIASAGADALAKVFV